MITEKLQSSRINLQRQIDKLLSDELRYNWIVALRSFKKEVCPDQFWTGTCWSPDLNEALVVTEYSEACEIQWSDDPEITKIFKSHAISFPKAYIRVFPIAVYRIFLQFPEGF